MAKPSAWILDQWLGVERVEFLRERQLKGVIEQHIESDSAEIDFIEGRGALNFLDIDEVPISDEGEYVDPASVITLPTAMDLPVLPRMGRSAADPFIQRVSASGKESCSFFSSNLGVSFCLAAPPSSLINASPSISFS